MALTMPPRHQEALRLREDERLTFREIGARLGVSIGRTHQILFRAEEMRRRIAWSATEQCCNWVAEGVSA
jgi:DNA-directed RNA polymerase specialized sigma24 family protein